MFKSMCLSSLNWKANALCLNAPSREAYRSWKTRVEHAQLRHIQDKSPFHHYTGHSKLTKTFDGMGPHRFRSFQQKNGFENPGPVDATILDKIKWNRKPQTPPPKSRMKPREGPKRAIFLSLIWGRGRSRFSIYFVQDCSLCTGRSLTCKKKKIPDFFWEGAVSTHATLMPPNFHSGKPFSFPTSLPSAYRQMKQDDFEE